MKTPASCPGCGTKLDPEMEACPNCPWSFTGQEEGENNPLKAESRLRDLALPVAFFGLLGWGIWRLGLGLLGAGMDASQAETGSLSTGGGPATKEQVAKTLEDSMKQLGAEGPAPGGTVDLVAQLDGRPQPGGSAGAAKTAGAERVAVMPADDATDAGEGSGTISIQKEAPGKAARAVSEWRLRGRVYDLVTLKPIAGARLVLLDNQTNARAETLTGADGRYKTVLPPLEGRGYVVTISKPGYAQSYAGPESAGVADLDAGSRKELARQLGRSVEAPASLEPGGSEPLVTDFFLAPR
ncbi:MAG: carboxypeptidase regulatory-like domain-containing protein [Elusimicrobiota bacterium]|nr:carboxypeptidase regulatory-like domain-containing protein [Elusimicrobiota bacterium]